MTKWILIRGLSREQRHWGQFVHRLARATGCQVICQDLPGFGTQSDIESPASISEIAKHLAPMVFSEKTLIDGKINIIGLSLGGMVAYELSKQHRTAVDRLVLINSSFRPYSHFYERLKPRSYPKLAKAFIHLDPRKSEQAILSMSSNRCANDPVLLNQWTLYRNDASPSRSSVVKQLFAVARYRVDERKPLDKLLLIAAKKDRVVDYRCSEKMAELWRCDLRLHEYGSHDLSIDAPDWLAKTISTWSDSFSK